MTRLLSINRFAFHSTQAHLCIRKCPTAVPVISQMDHHPVILPIRLQPSNLRPLAYRIISKKHGINIKSEALKILADFIGPKFGNEWKSINCQRFLEEIAKIWKEQERGLFLDGEGLEEVLKEIESLESKSVRASNQKPVSVEAMMAVHKHDSVQGSQQPQSDLDEDIARSRTSPATSVTPPPPPDSLDWKEYFRLVSAFDQPIFNYDFLRKQYDLSTAPTSKLLSTSVDSNISLFQRRYHILKDRLLRNENFQTNTFDPSAVTTNAITQIKNLLGRNNMRFLLLGMLTIINGEIYLQDTTDKILLNIEQAEPNPGSFYTPGNIVLCDGIYSNGTFYCSSIGHPPGERRAETLEANGNIDFLGIHANMRIDKELNQMLKAAESNLNHKLIVLGADCYLDNLRTFDALGKLFKKLSEDGYDLPISIIFNGSFSSVSLSSSEYKHLFDSLASTLEEYPRISGNVSLIFIPGNNDQWQTPIWPKTPIPKLFGSRLSRVARNVQWASNPTRLVYLSQEIVLTCDNLGSRFRRNTTIFPTVEKKEREVNIEDEHDEQRSQIERIEALPPRILEARKLVKTILDQGHLSPFTKDLKPVIWNLDHTLTLSPIPNILIMTDPTSPSYDVTYNGCRCLNPGQLISKRKLNYMEIDLSSKKAELKEVYF